MKIEVRVSGTEQLVEALNALTVALGNSGLPPLEVVAKSSGERNVVTQEEVRTKLAQFSQLGKQAELKALLAKYGAVKFSEVPVAKYAELLNDAEELFKADEHIGY